jgi:hypothetical protein
MKLEIKIEVDELAKTESSNQFSRLSDVYFYFNPISLL